MKKLSFILLASFFAFNAYAANTIPPDLVGEWATDNSEFNAGALTKGTAIYLNVDGAGAFIAAPPPIGSKLNATFDAKSLLLTLTLTEHGKPMSVFTFNYDPKTKVLKSGKTAAGADKFKRRQDKVPTYINEMMK